jgi:hypothetical protein
MVFKRERKREEEGEDKRRVFIREEGRAGRRERERYR